MAAPQPEDRGFFLIALSVIALMAIVYAFTSPVVTSRRSLARREAALRMEVKRQWERTVDLTRLRRRLKSDPLTIARVARRQSGCARPDQYLAASQKPTPTQLQIPKTRAPKPGSAVASRAAVAQKPDARGVTHGRWPSVALAALPPALALLLVGMAFIAFLTRPVVAQRLRSQAITPRS